MTLSEEQILAIFRAGPFRSAVMRNSGVSRLVGLPPERLTADEQGERYDYAMDLLTNDAPSVESYQAEQDLEPYTIWIRGVPGAFFVVAPDYDREGVYDTLEQARRVVQFQFGEFITSGPG